MKRLEKLEWGFLLLAIASLWPRILGWTGWWWDALLYLVAILLVILLWVRIQRFRAALEQQKRSLEDMPPPRFPWEGGNTGEP